MRTVQEDLEEALFKVLGQPCPVYTSSRTDAGVHGWRHPASLDLPFHVPLAGLVRGTNSVLRSDLAVLSARPVSDDFRIRKMSVSRSYRYFIWCRSVPEPFQGRTAWNLPGYLDVGAMNDAVAPLLGDQDFASFRSAHCDSKSTRRFLHTFHIERQGALVAMTITANAFLRNMVRILVGSVLEVGRGRRPAEWLGEVLEARDRNLAGPTVPAHGLFLLDVCFPEEAFALQAHEW